jgi:hypothetical protein
VCKTYASGFGLDFGGQEIFAPVLMQVKILPEAIGKTLFHGLLSRAALN